VTFGLTWAKGEGNDQNLLENETIACTVGSDKLSNDGQITILV